MDLTFNRDAAGFIVVGFAINSLDGNNSPDFRKVIRPVLEESATVVLDMQNLQFVDSSGLGALLSCMRFKQDHGGQLLISGLSKPVRTLFELMRLNRVFNIFNNVDEILLGEQA